MLLRVADEVVSVMDTVSFFVPASYLTTVKNVSNGMKLTLSLIRKYLPEGALSRIYLDEQPKDSGKYVAGAIALESSDINAAGFAMFKIKPKTENVSLSWAADAPSSMTVSQLQNADLTAKVISDGQVAENGKVNYTYKKKDLPVLQQQNKRRAHRARHLHPDRQGRGQLLLRQHQPHHYGDR